MACGLALLASGQAFAADYSHIGTPIVDADLTDGTKWINNAMTCGTGTAVGGTITMALADTVIVCVTHSLNLTSAGVFRAGTLVFDSLGGTWGGSALWFSAGSKTIVNQNTAPIAITSLGLGFMAPGTNIAIQSGPVRFVEIKPSSRGLNCTSGGADYMAGDIITAGTTCQVVAVIPPPTPPAVSAPIFSTKEKPAVFSEEVK